MRIIIIANIISFIGSLIMIGIGFIKEKRHILIVQSVQFGVMGTGNLLLGGMTGVVSNFLSIFRNVLCLYRPFTWGWKLLFVAVQGGLSLMVNEAGLIGWLPFAAACLYTLFLDLKDEKKLKAVMILCQLMWVVYDLSIKNYSAFVFDILTVVSNVIGIFMLIRSPNRAK